MHQVQLAATQMFDGATQIVGQDMPLRWSFCCRLVVTFACVVEASRTVAVESGSGIGCSAGWRPRLIMSRS
jgi:hypothetical protein